MMLMQDFCQPDVGLRPALVMGLLSLFQVPDQRQDMLHTVGDIKAMHLILLEYTNNLHLMIHIQDFVRTYSQLSFGVDMISMATPFILLLITLHQPLASQSRRQAHTRIHHLYHQFYVQVVYANMPLTHHRKHTHSIHSCP